MKDPTTAPYFESRTSGPVTDLDNNNWRRAHSGGKPATMSRDTFALRYRGYKRDTVTARYRVSRIGRQF